MIALSATEEYTSTAEVFVVTSAGGSASDLVQSGENSQKQVRSFTAMATRPIVLDPVIERLGLDLTADELAEQIRVTSPLNTVLMSISVTDVSAQRAARIADLVSEELASAVKSVNPTTEDGAVSVSLRSIRDAEVPTTPSAPNTRVLLALGVLLGLVAGVLVVAARETLNTRVRSADDVAEIAAASQLGAIAFDSVAVSRPVLRDKDKNTPRAETFRQIRTNIKFVGAVEPRKLLAITSSIPGEGKSTVSANIAITLATAGDRVCLVEADLRRPRLGGYLGLESKVGLTTVLVGDAEVSDVLQPWGSQQLDVLLSGQLPPNPAELLGSARMAEVLEQLRASYDVVVVDCPPLVPVTDGALLAKACGGAIVVVGIGRADRSELRFAVETLASINTHILGTILNLVPQQDLGRHGYGYGYGAAIAGDIPGKHSLARPRRRTQWWKPKGSRGPSDGFDALDGLSEGRGDVASPSKADVSGR